jgi:Leucine-rich repeat (LRR) protein
MRLEHVTQLELTGDGNRRGIGEFLRAFPNLTSLSVERHALQHIPDSVFDLDQLQQLNLSYNSIRLTPDNLEQLSRLAELNQLDLSDNPLT